MSRCPWCGGDAAAEVRDAMLAALREHLWPALEPRIRQHVAEAIAERLRPVPRSDPMAPTVSFTEARRLTGASHQTLHRAVSRGLVPSDYDPTAQFRLRWRIDRAGLLEWNQRRHRRVGA